MELKEGVGGIFPLLVDFRLHSLVHVVGSIWDVPSANLWPNWENTYNFIRKVRLDGARQGSDWLDGVRQGSDFVH